MRDAKREGGGQLHGLRRGMDQENLESENWSGGGREKGVYGAQGS